MSINSLFSNFKKRRFCKIGLLGKKVNLDSCTFCNLRCPICSVSMGLNKKTLVGEGFLNLENLKSLLIKNSEVKWVDFSGQGEPLLNPSIREILKYCFNKNINCSFYGGTNLNIMDDFLLEDLVRYTVKHLTIALDGVSQGIYSEYRRNGNLKLVLNNIKKINAYKKKYNSPFPELRWQFILFNHNKGEVIKAREMAKKLNMDFIIKINYSSEYSVIPNEDRERLEKELNIPAVSREEFNNKLDRIYRVPCSGLWRNPRINWDGNFFGCCINREFSFGNAFFSPLKKIMSSKKLVLIRMALFGLKKMPKFSPCLKCNIYKFVLKKKIEISDISNFSFS